MVAHQIFPLDDNLNLKEYDNERGALESISSSIGNSRYVYFVHRKTVIPQIATEVLTVYDLWTGSSSEYTALVRNEERLKEFYEVGLDEGLAVVESELELVILLTHLNHESREVLELDRIHVITKLEQRDNLKEYRCMRSEKGFTVLACVRPGILVLELQVNPKFVDVSRTAIDYDGQLYFLYTDPWREGDIIYCFESEFTPDTEEERLFNGNLFAIDLSRKEIHSVPPQFPFAPAICNNEERGVVQVLGVFHRPGHLWVVTQNTEQNAQLSIWRLDSDGWHAITTVENDKYEVTMDVCADGSAIVVLEDEVNGSPIMRNVRHQGVPTLFSLARTVTLRHLPGLRRDFYLTQLFSQRLFK